MAEFRATPYRYPAVGSVNELVGGLLGFMKDPRRTQQLQGLAGLLESTGIPKTVERLAYGQPLTNIGQANVPMLKPETAEALLTLLPVPVGANKAAKALDPVVQRYGPKLEQTLLPAFESAYNRGGVTREMVEAMGNVSNVVPQKTQSIVREGNPIQSAVVLIGDKIFTGRTHTDAFNRAIYEGVVRKENGKFIYPKDAEVNSDLFMTKDGQIIDRFQASRMFDIGASETAIQEGLMQNKPASSMSVNSYIEQAEAIKKQKERNAGLLEPQSKNFETSVTDASEIFGEGAKRIKYTDPNSGGVIDVLQRPDGSASVLGLEVPEAMRGQGIGQSLQSQVMQDFPEMMGQVSSKAAAKTAYRLGRRPPYEPDATLDDVYKLMDENSSVNLVSPQMQKRFMPELSQSVYPQEEAMRLAQQRAALPVEQGGLGLPANNTAEQRAAAMGFDKDIYHGSQNEISSIDFSRAGQNTGNPNATLGFFTTPNPQEGSRYATLHGNQINANVMPLRAKSSNSYEMPYKELDDMAMSPYNLMMADPNFNPNAIVKFGDMAAQKAAAERLQKYNKAASEQSLQRKKELMQEGFDSATVLPGKSMEEFIVFNPDIIRSRFAAFDPFRKTAATAALMGVAAPDLLAQEVDYTLLPPEKKKELLQSLLGQ